MIAADRPNVPIGRNRPDQRVPDRLLVRLQPEQDRRQRQHACIVGSALFIARRDASELLQSIDQPLNAVAVAIPLPVKGAAAPLVHFVRNRHADATPPEIPANLPATVAFIGDDPLGSDTWAPAAAALDRSLLHHLREDDCLVPLAGGDHERQRFAATFRPQMDFRAEAALRAA